MTVTTSHEKRSGTGGLARPDRQALPAVGVATAVILALAVAQQAFGHHNTDNSWLFTVGEKLLAGATPYVDVVETNPPASIMLYLPAVLLARVLHISTEFAANLLTFLSVAGLLQLTSRLLRRAGSIEASDVPLFWLGGIFALMLLPGSCFAEREHIAAATALPFLAVLAGRMAGHRPALTQALAAGLLAGLTVAIKPHFALALALPLGFALVRRRDWRLVLTLEAVVAALVIALYGGAVLLFFPHYLEMLPGLMDAYVAIKVPLSELILQPWPLLQMLLLAVLVLGMMRSGRAPIAAILLALASIGFTLAAIAQAKGWINHYLGGVALAMLALTLFLAPLAGDATVRGREWPRLRLLVLFALLPGLICGVFAFRQIYEEIYPGLADLVRRETPAHPRLIALSGELNVGHPLVRQIDGVWVGRPGALWLMVTSGVMLKSGIADPAYSARLNGYIQRDAAMFLEDVRAQRPDAILVEDEKYPKLVKLAPGLTGALDGYAKSGTADGISVWVRKSGV